MKLFRLLAITVVASGMFTHAGEQTKPCTVKFNLDSYKKYAPLAAIAALGSGMILKNRVLTGAGVGTLTGMGTALFEKDVPWVMLWLAEWSARLGLTFSLCPVKPQEIELTPEELEEIEHRTVTIEKSLNQGLISTSTTERRAENRADKIWLTKITKFSKAYASLGSAAWYSSWGSYLMFKYLERKQKQQA